MANDKTNYSEKIEELLKEIPNFVSDYIYNFMNGENPSTMLQYTRDILDFLRLMVNSLPEYDDKTMKELTLEDLSKLNSFDVNRYLTFVRGSREHRYTKKRTDKNEKLLRIKLSTKHFFSYRITGDASTVTIAFPQPVHSTVNLPVDFIFKRSLSAVSFILSLTFTVPAVLLKPIQLQSVSILNSYGNSLPFMRSNSIVLTSGRSISLHV